LAGRNSGTFGRVLHATGRHARREGGLRGLASDLRALGSMVRDWSRGSYRGVSKKALMLTAGAALYFVSPLDVIPDWLLGLGQVDDVAVLGLWLSMIRGEVSNYRLWRDTIVGDDPASR